MEKERTVATHEADAAIEAEIAHLRADEYVRLAKRYEYAPQAVSVSAPILPEKRS